MSAARNECECHNAKGLERVLYQRVCEDGAVYTEENELLDFEGELVGVYTLSHIARVDVEPERAVLRIVDIP